MTAIGFVPSAERLLVQTRNSVEPGRYSQRNTAFPLNDRVLKLRIA